MPKFDLLPSHVHQQQLAGAWTLWCQPQPCTTIPNRWISKDWGSRLTERNSVLWHTLHSPSNGFPGSTQSAVPPTRQTASLKVMFWIRLMQKLLKNVSVKSKFYPSWRHGLIRKNNGSDTDPKNVSLINPLLACSGLTFKRKPLR